MTDATPVTYYALLAGGTTPDDPSGLVRRTHTSPLPTDEALHRDGRWHPTEYLYRYWLGHNDIDHVEITEEEAMTIASRWKAEWGIRR